MCGIVGYNGKKEAAPILLEGLTKLEYRGYDSAGIAVEDENNIVNVIKAKGRLDILKEKTENGNLVHGKIGIGHTRWATHGEPSEENAHPHNSNDNSVIGVHNGIIENYQELREKLIKNGYKFFSQTDTEVAINLIDYYLKKYKIGPVDAINRSLVRIRGSYALEVLFKDYPGKIYVARKDSPIIIGVNNDESFVASDVPAILKYTNNVYYVDNLELACVECGKVTFYDLNGDVVQKEPVKVTIDPQSAEKGGYEHFMMKEIHEQPKVISDTINSIIKEDRIDLANVGLTKEVMEDINQIIFVACGSAYHVGVVGQYLIEDFARIPSRVELASEFRYRNPIIDKKDLVVVISQSGETADSLAALRLAKEKGAKTLGIVNVVGSSIAREADNVLYTLAGPEIAVATTKAYSTQLIAIYCLAIEFGKLRQIIDGEKYIELIGEIKSIPDKIQKILDDKERIQWFASKFSSIKDAFFIGRGIDYAISLEGSLKMKEISYIHSEAYAAGELKHGTISLIENNTLVISILTQPQIIEKTLSNMVEVKSRGVSEDGN